MAASKKVSPVPIAVLSFAAAGLSLVSYGVLGYWPAKRGGVAALIFILFGGILVTYVKMAQ